MVHPCLGLVLAAFVSLYRARSSFVPEHSRKKKIKKGSKEGSECSEVWMDSLIIIVTKRMRVHMWHG